MLELKIVELKDRIWMDKLLKMSERGSQEYSFTSTFLWRKINCYKVAQVGDYLVLMADLIDPSYLFPAGKGPLKPVIDEMLEDATERGHHFVIHTVLPEGKKQLEELYPGKFIFELQVDTADYIYSAQSLMDLAGRHFSGKRNHINRFVENNPDWQYEVIDENNIKEAYEMNELWCKQAGCKKEESLRKESCAVEQAFQHYFDLGLSGGLLRAKGEVIAFSMGDELNETTFIVHIEKAFATIQGAYPMINKQFAIHNFQNYQYVNREDDSGDLGLRKAKLSYMPLRTAEKYSAKYIV